ncbi:unnamed protein product [Clonostachys byssicola]|uniref:Gfd2/YDR514C-like C-terminal domain-containing protein n=1 Tax=Clonostachys byssicola TaxID=160290 RepID=A0A9N9XTV0_9HYPO|nr:unnamed protein product [Clonostachys byssicola]
MDQPKKESWLTTLNPLYPSLLEGSKPELRLPSHESNPPMYTSLRPVGDERRALANIRSIFGYHPRDLMRKRDLGNYIPKSHVRDMRDVLFLSVSICPSTIQDQGYVDVGISVFDTRYLDNGLKTGRRDEEWALCAVRSYHFCLVADKWGVTGSDCRFNFGHSTVITPEQLPACVADIVYGRDYVVVVSNPESRPESLQHKLGVDLGLDPLCCVDVVSIYNLVMEERHTKLGSIVAEMGLFRERIDHPGNAAHYNLRALLGVVTLDATMNGWEWSADFIWCAAFIANSPEALYTQGYGKEWVDWFFHAHLNLLRMKVSMREENKWEREKDKFENFD